MTEIVGNWTARSGLLCRRQRLHSLMKLTSVGILLSLSSLCLVDARQRGGKSSMTNFLSEEEAGSSFVTSTQWYLRQVKPEQMTRRRVMEKVTDEPTLAPSDVPTFTVGPTPSPSENPSSSPPPTNEPTSSPTMNPTSSPAPTSDPSSGPTIDPIQSITLQSFSVMVKGDLDEMNFRSDLELYLLGEMNMAHRSVIDVSLEPAPAPSQRGRHLQQAYVLEYTGEAVIDATKEPLVTAENVILAQTNALEDTDRMQHFLDLFSEELLEVQQVQVAGRDPVLVQDASEIESTKDKGNGKVIIGVLVGVLILAIGLSVVIYIQFFRKPPPPPPMEVEIIPEVDEEGNQQYDMEVVLKDVKPTQKSKKGKAEKKSPPRVVKNGEEYEYFTDQDNLSSSAGGFEEEPPPPPSSPPPADSTLQFLPQHAESTGQEVSSQYSKPIVDLNASPPPQTARGRTKTRVPNVPPQIKKGSSQEQVDESMEVKLDGKKEEVVEGHSNRAPRSQDVPIAGKESPPDMETSNKSEQEMRSLFDDDTTFGMVTIKSNASMTDNDSMEGYSLATDQRSLSPVGRISNDYRRDNTVADLAQPKWLQQPRREFVSEKKSEDIYISTSDSESTSTNSKVGSDQVISAAIGNQLISNIGVEDSIEVGLPHMFVDDDEDEEPYSSYKEEDNSYRGDCSLTSGVSDSDGVYLSPGRQEALPKSGDPGSKSPYGGALGLFHHYDDEEEELLAMPKMLGQLPPGKSDDLTPRERALRNLVGNAEEVDSYSDVPSDELNAMIKNNRKQEQDLSGFPTTQRTPPATNRYNNNSKASTSTVQHALAAWSPPASRNNGGNVKANNDGSPNSASPGHSSVENESYYSGNSWDNAEDPDVDHLMKERRRIKRAARKQRAERKQPPVTMEV